LHPRPKSKTGLLDSGVIFMNTSPPDYTARRLGAILFAAFFFCVGVAVSHLRTEPSHSSIAFMSGHPSKYETAQAESVTVQVADGTGSGVVIKRTTRAGKPEIFVWTARHVVAGFTNATIVRSLHFAGHKAGTLSFKAKVLCRLPNADAALLWVDCPTDAFPGAVWTEEDNHPGDNIFTVGTMLSEFDGSITAGVLSQVGVLSEKAGWPWGTADQADFRIAPGSSGGPVFDYVGNVIGIVVGGPRQGAIGISIFIPVREIEKDAAAIGIQWAIRGQFCATEEILNQGVAARIAEVDAAAKPGLSIVLIPETPKKVRSARLGKVP